VLDDPPAGQKLIFKQNKSIETAPADSYRDNHRSANFTILFLNTIHRLMRLNSLSISSPCDAAESLLVARSVAQNFLPKIGVPYATA
jgi:hypothetical protein